jgi:hypothetical protein
MSGLRTLLGGLLVFGRGLVFVALVIGAAFAPGYILSVAQEVHTHRALADLGIVYAPMPTEWQKNVAAFGPILVSVFAVVGLESAIYILARTRRR